MDVAQKMIYAKSKKNISEQKCRPVSYQIYMFGTKRKYTVNLIWFSASGIWLNENQ